MKNKSKGLSREREGEQERERERMKEIYNGEREIEKVCVLEKKF